MSRNLTKIFNNDIKTASNDPDHEYIDFNVVNSTNTSTELNFTDNKVSSIITNAGDYYVAVSRFTLDCQNVPVFIPIIQKGQTDPNLTIYSFTLQYKTFLYRKYVEWIPQYKNLIVQQPLIRQDLSNNYYFTNSFSHVIECFNDTLSQCFAELQNLTNELENKTAPYITFDPSTKEMIISTTEDYDVKTAENPIYIWCNSALQMLLNGFRWDNYGENQLNGLDYRLNIYNDNNFNKIVDADDNVTIQAYEETASVVCFNPVSSISFKCQMLPMNGSIVPDPLEYGSNNKMQYTTTNLTTPQITDFTVALDNNTISYYPRVDLPATNIYRLIDLVGHGYITHLNISCVWKDHYNNEYPLKLKPYASSNMKLVFRKKSYNNDL